MLKEANFPLSLSFRSRLRQKTQEKIEEKQKNRVEKMKKEKQKKELETLNTSAGNRTHSPTADHDTSLAPNQSNKPSCSLHCKPFLVKDKPRNNFSIS